MSPFEPSGISSTWMETKERILGASGRMEDHTQAVVVKVWFKDKTQQSHPTGPVLGVLGLLPHSPN